MGPLGRQRRREATSEDVGGGSAGLPLGCLVPLTLWSSACYLFTGTVIFIGRRSSILLRGVPARFLIMAGFFMIFCEVIVAFLKNDRLYKTLKVGYVILFVILVVLCVVYCDDVASGRRGFRHR